MDNNPIVTSGIIEDAFLISCLVLALQNVEQATSRNPESDIFLDDCQTSIESMLLKRLLATAGMIRNVVFEKYPIETRNDEWRMLAEREVGLLLTDGNETTLLFRDSCNKILHHRSYGFPASTQLAGLSLKDCAQFSGTRQKSEWHAIVNLHQFASTAYMCADIGSRA
ncbi:hypothetical protein [Mesorhizobium sp. L48C026A00]|uniref:hypothetical protein n=1 Tax=Mesorhizobium sp. L48C026A00 TaxID=1287182 RepID=UPI0003D019F8|nr:hypothetical protein [Mesorhizobium sp. L48C026A00]ESZ11910.1 hypothetical protein X737_28970 [Mesorhizobium sp. L48C026A00]